VRVPPHDGKAVAVIGVRRAGKSTFLRQQLANRLAEGRQRESLLLLSLEDDRLAGIGLADLDWMLEEIFRQQPHLRAAGRLTLCLDEIQVVPEWERFVRRVLDTESLELFLSGSSAKLLSREVSTTLRGRGVEVLMHPFSFREALRHGGEERPSGMRNDAERTRLDAALRQYLTIGGFAEAQGLDARDRVGLLRGYVDVMTLRDVIERHAVSNPIALRWLQRELLATPGGMFSISKLSQVMTSQGIAVGKDTLHAYLGHLEDAFLVRTVWMHSTSERQRMVNPRKVYPVDPGLIPLYERGGRAQTGRALETVVMLELERRGYDLHYVRTADGVEVDFLATHPAMEPLLVQVAATTAAPDTMAREVRGLASAMREHPRATPLLLTMDATVPRVELPTGARWIPASEWLLEG
jgi:predicted AAA+ superfamily ATPase